MGHPSHLLLGDQVPLGVPVKRCLNSTIELLSRKFLTFKVSFHYCLYNKLELLPSKHTAFNEYTRLKVLLRVTLCIKENNH